MEKGIASRTLRAFAFRMLNAICKVYLAFFPQKSPTSGIANAQNCKLFYNLATVPFYMWHRRLLDMFFNLIYSFSLLYVRLLNSLSVLLLFSLTLVLWFALSFLQTQTPSSSQHQHHISQWFIFPGGLRSNGFCDCFFFFFFLAVTGA